MKSMEDEVEYYYKIYGLCVQSDLCIEEAIQIEENCNVNVTVKTYKIDSCNYDKKETCWSKAFISFYIENVAIYQIIEGNEIHIFKEKEADADELKCFLLGSSFGFLMIQRGHIALHGSCMVKDNKAIIITGESGAGKSTTATWLSLKDYKFISDDVTAIKYDDRVAKVFLAYPQRKLCKDAAIMLGYNINLLKKLYKRQDKYAVILKENEYVEESILGLIVELCINSDGSEIVVKELTGHEKMFAFMSNIYREGLFRKIGLSSLVVKEVLEIVKTVPMFQILRPVGTNSEESVIEILLSLKDMVDEKNDKSC